MAPLVLDRIPVYVCQECLAEYTHAQSFQHWLDFHAEIPRPKPPPVVIGASEPDI